MQPKLKYLIGIALWVLGLYFIVSTLPQVLVPTNLTLRFFVSRILFWLWVGLLFFYSRKIEKGNFLLWAEQKASARFYLISFLVMVVICAAGTLLFSKLLANIPLFSGHKINNAVDFLKNNKLLLLFTTFTAGVGEELIYRGYILPRLSYILKSRVGAVILSSILFAIPHFGYGSLIQVVNPLFMGLVFGAFYAKYRNLKLLIFLHFFWDTVSLLLL